MIIGTLSVVRKINHPFYMDGLRLYIRSEKELDSIVFFGRTWECG